jgi:invasion protein IalB
MARTSAPACRAGLAAILLACVCAPSVAQVEAIGRYKDWRVFTQKAGGDTICFAATTATDKAPKDLEHGEVTFYVASWKSGAAANQPSLKVGYDLRQDLAPSAIVNRERYRMFASGPEAFIDDDREKALLAALKKGTEMRVEAAAKAARTAYYFSLKGSTEAIDAARALCR